jgi:hypothetical protein
MSDYDSWGDFLNFYETWVDEIVASPIVRPQQRRDDIDAALRINNNLINNIHNIRRMLATDMEYTHSAPSFLQEYSFNTTWNTEMQQDSARTHNQQAANTVLDVLRNALDYVLDSQPSANQLQDVKVTINKDDFEKLSQTIITEENKSLYEKDCNICFDNFETATTLVTLPCNHYFHKKCIRDWLCNEKVTCPVCRTDVRTKQCTNEATI